MQDSDEREHRLTARLGPQARLAVAALACVTTTLLATPLLGVLDLANIVMLFLLTVLLVAVALGMRPALLAAVLSVALFDFFFVPPRFSFAVQDAQYLVTFGVMLAVAGITGRLAAGLRERADAAAAEARRTRALYEMARDLSAALHTGQVAEIARDFLRRVMRAESVILLADADGILAPCPEAVDAAAPRVEPRLATIAYERGEAAKSGGLLAEGYAALYVPLETPTRRRGVVALSAPAGGRELPDDLRGWLETMVSLVAIAIERVHYVDVAQRTQLQVVSERLRSSILSAISHDLRSPLTALYGLADSLVEYRPPLDAGARETAEAIRDQAERLSGMVGNLLDMARLHAGTIALNKEWQPVEEVVGSSIKLLGRALAAHPVKVVLAPGLPLLEFDAVLIERVFCNLLENAAKYSPLGSPIEIAVGVEDGQAVVRVDDRGAGFPAGSGREVFEMFVRGARESTVHGVGLGLAISSAIVAAHGGTIDAADRSGGGASVRFTLPLGTPPAVDEEVAGETKVVS